MGERRRIVDVLIENARLLAEKDAKDEVIQGKDKLIDELKEDQKFLREEVREARKHRGEVTSIAERMLDTLKTLAIGRLGAGDSQREQPRHTTAEDVTP